MDSRLRYHEFRAMSTHILLTAEGHWEDVQHGFEQAQAFILASERRFTRFSDESELAALNRSAGEWFAASPDMFEVVSQAVRLHRLTRGIFDPGVLAALERAGYTRTIAEVRAGRAPVLAAPAAPAGPLLLADVCFEDISLDEQDRRIKIPSGLRIDLGGIAKGWIAERAALLLSACSSACAVDAGGDIFLCGIPQGKTAWRVGLEDPQDPNQNLAILKVPPGAVATSTITRRRWQQSGRARHHLIDPRTRLPAETDWLSVTVIAPHAAEAEAFAKSLLIGGSRESEQTARLAGPVHFIAVDKYNKLWGSKHMWEFFDGSR